MDLLVVSNLCKKFNNNFAIRNLNLKVKKGEIVFLIGPNGAGKTTTLKLISGLLKPDSGRILIHNFDVSKEPTKAKRNMGLLYEQPYLYPKLTGWEFLEFIFSIYNTKIDKDETIRLTDGFGMSEFMGSLIESYSFGMKQKLLLMSIILRKPELILLDEPFYGLDPKSQALLEYKLNKLKGTSGILISTHILELAERVADKIFVIDNGMIIAEGKKDEIISNKNESLREVLLKLTSQ